MTSRARTTDRRYYGVAEALVTAVNDSGQEGRIKLRLPWFNEEFETEWSRVSQFYAGNGYGAFFIPEVGDEVLVAFVHGDMRFPVIIGGLYNGQDKPPSFRADDKDEKMIRTKSGHRITLDDTSGSEKITIVDKTGANSIVINSTDNSITITSEKDITLSATKGTITLDAKNLEIKSSADSKIEAGAGMDVKASATMNIKGQTVNIN
jgi:phage baseplate assembly protein V